MAEAARLYERAVPTKKPNPLLHVGPECTFWTGAADYLAEHCGSAPVFLASLYGKFRMRLAGQPWTLCGGAILPAGKWHELDFSGEPFAALYLEPGLGRLDSPRPFLGQVREVNGALIGIPNEISMLRSFYEDLCSEHWLQTALRDMLKPAGGHTRTSSLDPRVGAIVELFRNRCDDSTPLGMLARNSGLSSSRFQHVFTKEMGIPFRRYRLWNRLRMAWREIAKGATVTAAAHECGFFDSAHFAHEYRRTFGKAYSNGFGSMVRTTS
jgi:AraC-like DNA-binding protein